MIWGNKIWGSSGPFVGMKFGWDEPVVTEAFDVGSGVACHIVVVQSELKLRRNDRDCG